MSVIPSETPVSQQQLAEEILNAIRVTVQRVPGFAHPTAAHRRKTAASAASLTDEAFQAVATACDAHPHLAVANQITSAEIREMLAFCALYQALVADFPIHARGVAYAIASRRSALAVRARRVYDFAKGLNKPADRELLVPHIDAIKEALKRPKKRAAATPPATPAPQPPASPAPSVAKT